MSTGRSTMPSPADLPALRLIPTPSWEPPFDDELARRRGARGTSRPVDDGQDELALTYLLPTGVPAVPERPRLRLVRPGDVDGPDDELLFEAQPTSSIHLPDPQFWGGRLAQALFEVDAGVRPVAQLRRWLTEEVFAQVRWQSQRRQLGEAGRQRQHGQQRRQPPRLVVRSVRVCEPADGVAEVCAVVHDGARARALALRLEGTDGRWRATVVQPV